MATSTTKSHSGDPGEELADELVAMTATVLSDGLKDVLGMLKVAESAELGGDCMEGHVEHILLVALVCKEARGGAADEVVDWSHHVFQEVLPRLAAFEHLCVEGKHIV